MEQNENNMQEPKELSSTELDKVNAGYSTYGNGYIFSKGDAFSNYPHFFIVQDNYPNARPEDKILCDEYCYNDDGIEELLWRCWQTASFLGEECVPMH